MDMLKSATRRVGIATLVKKSLHSRGSDTSVADAPTTRRKQVDGALVEPEVVDSSHDLPIFDEVDAVARQAREQEGLRVDLADVPQCRQQQSAFGACRSAGQQSTSSRRLQARGCRSWESAADPVKPALNLVCPSADSCATVDPGGAVERQTVVEDRLRGSRGVCHDERGTLHAGVRRVAQQRDRARR